MIELLGQSLKEGLAPLTPFNIKNKRYFYSLMLQLVDNVQTLHSLNFVHADLKLQNMCFGLNNKNKLYLIDFGSTFCYVSFDDTHKINRFDRRYTGNFLFSSMHICRGSSPSRRDDIESILYIIVNTVVESKLPWSHFGKFYSEQNLPKLRYARSTPEAVQEVYELLPESYQAYYKSLCSLKYEDKPDYSGLKNCILTEIARLNEFYDETGPVSKE